MRNDNKEPYKTKKNPLKLTTLGFTLVELLAVIVVLGVILAIAVPQVTKTIANSKVSAYERTVSQVENAARLYVASNPDEQEVTLEQLVTGGYLELTPEDPRTKEELDGTTFLYGGEVNYSKGLYNGTHNEPTLSSNMYPVIWDGSNWIVTTMNDPEWYTYNADEDIDNSGDTDKDDGQGAFTSEKWANVQVTNTELNAGEVINEIDLNLYVWIPRYTYKLDEDSQTIEYKYSKYTTDNTSGGYISHPGFTFGTEDLEGIWVAKFEMSANTASNDYGTPSGEAVVVSRPNVKPWRQISVNDIFNEARTIETEYSLSADSHMMKSSEWSAVAYLTEAIRDGEEVWINNQGWYDGTDTTNNYKFITTGCAGTSKSSGDNNATSAECPSGYDYKTAGVKASTTGNIYGIYDMVGGSWEYMATYINDDTGSRLSASWAALALAEADSKYKEMFDISGSSDTTNYTNASNLTEGLAIHETSTSGSGATSWYNDHSYFPYENNPVVRRGGHFGNGSGAGVVAFYRGSGGAAVDIGWRVSLGL